MDETPLEKASDLSTRYSSGGCSQIFGALLGVTLLFVGVPCLLLGLSNLMADHFPLSLPIFVPAGRFQSILLATMGGFFTVLGFIALTTWVRAAVVSSKLGPVEVKLYPGMLRRGDTVTCAVRLKPRGSIELIQATVTLAASAHPRTESSFTDDGPPVTKQPTIFQTEEILAAGRRVRAREEAILTATLTLPTDAPCTAADTTDKLTWIATVDLRFRGLPDWTGKVPLIVLP
ncbi:MAG: hypothetical protein ACE145_02725 [Terriglobia bacterium]